MTREERIGYLKGEMSIVECERQLWLNLENLRLSNLRAMTKFEAEEAEKNRRKLMENKKEIVVK